MTQVIINYWAVLVAAIVNMALGFAWYGPLFGKYWIKLMGITPEQAERGRIEMQKKMWGIYGMTFIGSLLMSFVLYHSIFFASSYLNVTGILAGFMGGFWSWLGFILPVSLSAVFFEGKSWRLFILNNGYYLTVLLIMGAILALWM